MDYIVTVMAQDRVGIVRDVSSALADLGGNITHLSQTVLRGYFTLIISVEMPNGRTPQQIRKAVETRGLRDEFEVNVRLYDGSSAPSGPESERFVLSMRGRDRKGIIARTTAYLAERGVNIVDFYCYVHEGILLMLAQVSIPLGVNAEEVQSGLEKVGAEFGLAASLQHENIFRATSQVGPVIALRRDRT